MKGEISVCLVDLCYILTLISASVFESSWGLIMTFMFSKALSNVLRDNTESFQTFKNKDQS